MFRALGRPRSAATLLAAGLLAAAVAACSTGSSTTSASSSPADPGTGSATSSSIAAAQAYAAPYLKAPTSIGITTKLKTKPAAGKLLVKLIYPTPTEQAASRYTAEAAALIGWKYKAITVAATPEGIQQAFDSALQLSPAPAVIEEAGYDVATFKTQLAEAKQRGIDVVTDSATAPAGPDGISATINAPAAAYTDGKIMAAYAIGESNGNVHAASFNISSITVINNFVTGFQAGLKEWCSSCTDMVVNQQESDLGTDLPQNVVSALQANPSVNYAVFSFGDMTEGVDQALRVAGLASKVKIIGQTADTSNIAAIKAGTEDAFVSFNNPLLGFETVDAAARLTEGMTEPASTASWLPEQIITKANVGSILVDSSGQYYGIQNYADDYKALWNVG
jgi:ribose transport system substrate-binding protein